MITDKELDEIAKRANGEDWPGDVWFIDTVLFLIEEIKRLRQLAL